MIEGPGGPKSAKGSPGDAGLKRLAGRVRDRSEVLWRWALPAPSRHDSDGLLWRLHLAERISWIVLAALGAYVCVDLFVVKRPMPTMVVQAPQVEHPSRQPAATTAAERQLQPVETYREAILSRQPFGGGGRQAARPDSSDQNKEQLLAMTKGLSVVGINRGRVPEALIEDAAAGRTHFLKIGDKLNELTVKSIDQNGVTVSYEGEETVLP